MFYKRADNDLRRILGGSWRLSAWVTAGNAGIAAPMSRSIEYSQFKSIWSDSDETLGLCSQRQN